MRWMTSFLVAMLCTAAPWASAQEMGADFIHVDKSDRRLELRRNGRVIGSYEISLGGNPEGPKRQEGDERTPEGSYTIDFRKADSAYHLSLHISYPNQDDRAASAALGAPTGGDIFIHGLPNRYPFDTAPKVDWTAGCIALDNAEIEEIWRLVPDGTPILIVP
jgi:murein L,D-transpeptidase YafK